MSERIATIVSCGDQTRHVIPTVASIERQLDDHAEIILVTDESTDPRARAWINAFANKNGFISVHADKSTPGTIRNTGIQASRCPYIHCLDAGDQLEQSFHQKCRALLDAEPRTQLVTSGVLMLGPGSARRMSLPTSGEIQTFVRDPDAIHGASMFRRNIWATLGGFDETLPCLEDYEFWLRILETGGACKIIDRHSLIRSLRRDSLYHRARMGETWSRAIASIVRRHLNIFESDHVAVLHTWEKRLLALTDENDALLARRQQALTEIECFKARGSKLLSQLSELEHRTLDLGELRRTTPIARDWGYERGTPVDRYYIEKFLEKHAADISGAVLEVQESDYTRRFGGNRVTKSDVIDLDPSNTRATIVSDLRCAANIATGTYDCVILTQTLHVIDDMASAVTECARILKPGGVLLATLPCASRVSVEYGHDGDFWRVTDAGARCLFSTAFPAENLTVESHGNVFSNLAFLYGFCCEELTTAEFDAFDPYFPMLVSVRAEKPGASRCEPILDHRAHIRRSLSGSKRASAAVLLYHRVALPASDIHKLAVTPSEFREQISYLYKHYHPMPLHELAWAARDGKIPAGAIAITFDDGYLDSSMEASVVLSEFGVPATFFLTTDRLDDEYEFWWDILEQTLLLPHTIPGELSLDLPGGMRRFVIRTAAERLTVHHEIYTAIAGVSAEVRDEIIGVIRRWSGLTCIDPAERRMNRAEIASIAQRLGHSIGAHSVRHLMLPMQSPEVQREEIEQSKRDLEAIIGASISVFAYPFGAWSNMTRDIVRAAGFKVALACDDGVVPHHPDLLALPRLEVAARIGERFDEWLLNRVGPPRPSRVNIAVPPALTGTPPGEEPPTSAKRALVAGWFSYMNSDFTAGDLLACDLVCDWLQDAGLSCDVAHIPPFPGGVDLATVNPSNYTIAVFVCGPFMQNNLEAEFLARFANCLVVGVNLTLPVPLSEWNPFDLLIERDSSEAAHPDITFISREPLVPVIGVCLVEPYGGAEVPVATAAIERLVMSREISVVTIDTRLDVNTTGLRTKAEVESLLARMDVVVTTRLHGMVLSLKNGVPVVAIDPEVGGAKIKRQAEIIGWPIVFTVDTLDEIELKAALDYCLTDEAREKARACKDRAMAMVEEIRHRFIESIDGLKSPGVKPWTCHRPATGILDRR
jgi:peptidoglycan/xylan/chitin deacetylase (PgdA/CDA1 family)/SAM-dependent methyltransferase